MTPRGRALATSTRAAALGLALAGACANFDRRVDAGGADVSTAELPPPPARALTGAARVGAGRWHTCAVDAAGSAWCWGQSEHAQTGTTVARACPEGPCVPLATRVVGVSELAEVGGGSVSTCARSRGGSVYCWGDNTYGQGGEGVGPARATPTPVPTLPALRDLAVGGAHACGASMTDGAVYCWGYGEIGQFGDGARPVAPRGATRVGALAGRVAVGDAHGCSVDGSSVVRCWGATTAGQSGVEPRDDCTATALGRWPTRCVVAPVSLPAFGAPVAEVALGHLHSCARLTSGAVWCWGSNERGQLGGDAAGASCVVPNDSQSTRSVPCSAAPVRVAGLDPAERIWSGMRANHTCARLRGGALRCWGDNRWGQLGDGSSASSPTPREARGVAGASDLAAGERHTCAVVAGGRVLCWGDDALGQRGDDLGASAGPAYVLGAP